MRPWVDCACTNCKYKLLLKGQFLSGITAGVRLLSMYQKQILLGCLKQNLGEKICSSRQLGKIISSEFIKHLRKSETTNGKCTNYL